ncbi:MAG: type IVB secretion system protein IcmF [Legionellaceae bacterium]|nr:type IVB secretion system protein IcmF [Legionellaceae bacterium]
MDNSVRSLCQSLRQVLDSLHPQHHTCSFVLLVGAHLQGKTTLLQHSGMTECLLENIERVRLFYNQQGVVLELGDLWLQETPMLLRDILKQLNTVHKAVRISGVMFALDVQELLHTQGVADNHELVQHIDPHLRLMRRVIQELGYPIDTFLVLTKMDSLAGFCDFFQRQEREDPLGFSFSNDLNSAGMLQNEYKQGFDTLITALNASVIKKLHRVHSQVRRTHIREFPLQFSCIRKPLYLFLQMLLQHQVQVKAVYFTSAQQSDYVFDRLSSKIQKAYALMLPDRWVQSTQVKTHFVQETVSACLSQTQTQPMITHPLIQRWVSIGGSVFIFLIAVLGYTHWNTSALLGEAQQALSAYGTAHHKHETAALYYLSHAEKLLNQVDETWMPLGAVHDIQQLIQGHIAVRLEQEIIPQLLAQLERVMTSQRLPIAERFQALRTYVMLFDPHYFSQPEISAWFQQYDKTHPQDQDMYRLRLSERALAHPIAHKLFREKMVADIRMQWEALPPSFIYYQLAKAYFPQNTEAVPDVLGISFPMKNIPEYYTREGFENMQRMWPQIIAHMQADAWVLGRPLPQEVQTILETAYVGDYKASWTRWMTGIQPSHLYNYKEGQQTLDVLQSSQGLEKVIAWLQTNIGPTSVSSSLFNKEIASQFTYLNAIGSPSIQAFQGALQETSRFVGLLSLVDDGGKTTFELVKQRFTNTMATDPLSQLYRQAQQLPEPLSLWAKQLADDIWILSIQAARAYINQAWEKAVYIPYTEQIAHHYPFDSLEAPDVSMTAFNGFFAPSGTFMQFMNETILPFIDTSSAEWKPKEVNGLRLPIIEEAMNEFIRANVISKMFFAQGASSSMIEFSLQKISLDPVVARLQLSIGDTQLKDNQTSESFTTFHWPAVDAKLRLDSIEGKHYELDESGAWALFRMLQKVNVLVDAEDSTSLQILFEINGNSGRYVLKTNNPINPLSPGILEGFVLAKTVV